MTDVFVSTTLVQEGIMIDQHRHSSTCNNVAAGAVWVEEGHAARHIGAPHKPEHNTWHNKILPQTMSIGEPAMNPEWGSTRMWFVHHSLLLTKGGVPHLEQHNQQTVPTAMPCHDIPLQAVSGPGNHSAHH